VTSRASTGERPVTTLAPDGLALALVLAARACEGVRQKHSLTETLKAALASADGVRAMPQARAAAQDLAFTAMRQRGRGDALLARLTNRAPDPAGIGELLVIALILLDAREHSQGLGNVPHYAPHTLVDQAVEAAGALVPKAGEKALKGFVNAVLRRALSKPAGLFTSVQGHAAEESVEHLNYPLWWIDQVRRAYPIQWRAILASGQSAAPLTLRVNRRRIGVTEAIAQLAGEGIEAVALSDSAIRLVRARRVELIPGFADGLFSVQDEAAQRAAPLLDLQHGLRVLDACAAPGGKSGHILELADVDLTALDIDQQRLERVADNLRRLKLSARLMQGDAGDSDSWWDGQGFDRILADLPCSASGIVRRHPDIRWLRRKGDLISLSRRQQHLLDTLWRLLVPNGKLLVVTCSIFPQEGVQLADRFLSRHPDARALAAPGQLLPEATEHVNHDGLFYSLIEKVA
jgi:16S rRNA (cytosine967-C5)-methyltransferase